MSNEQFQTPFCKICEACGMEGCCPPTVCAQHAEGEYCLEYLVDLKFGYELGKSLYNLIDSMPPEVEYWKNAAKKIFDNLWENYYHKDGNTQEDFINNKK